MTGALLRAFLSGCFHKAAPLCAPDESVSWVVVDADIGLHIEASAYLAAG
ncbi:hypothetical protein [Nonomuraea basaltis]|nr:hypothetical protein [Nonomuraea basaltis]